MISADKQTLLERSAICRVRLQHDIENVRRSLHWSRVALAVAPPIGKVALGAAFSALAFSRATRWAAIAGRALLFVKLARAIVGRLRGRA